jgi:hypothetical protein
MIWINQLSKFSPQNLNLFVIQRANTCEIAVSVKEVDLILESRY